MAKRQLTFETELQKYVAEATPLGNGGSGTVYAATGVGGERYAIKVLSPDVADSAKLKRFRNELNFGRTVRHDHIVPVLDSGSVERGGKSTPFFVMPRYASSLRDLINPRIEPDRALRLFDGVLDALEFAHARSVWHRDLKPENVLFDDQADRLVLADFGIAHFEQDDLVTAVKTKNADRLANFAYAAPEQRQKGADVDHRADIYAAGLILSEMVAGSVPHGAKYPKIGDISARYAYLDSVVERAISSRPDDRYPSVDALRTDLRLLAEGPGLAFARSVIGAMNIAKEKERLFWSTEGVNTVRQQVKGVFDHVEGVLRVISTEQRHVKLTATREDDSMSMKSGGTSVTLSWYQQASNMLESARLTLWSLPNPLTRGEPTKLHEFWPDYDTEGWCWKEAGRRIDMSEVASRVVKTFFEKVKTDSERRSEA